MLRVQNEGSTLFPAGFIFYVEATPTTRETEALAHEKNNMKTIKVTSFLIPSHLDSNVLKC